LKLDSIEKDKQPSVEILRLFEKTRVAYLSAKEDPKEYSSRWQNAVDIIIESYEKLNAVGKELKRFIEEEDLKDKDTKNPESLKAQKLFEDIKLLRYTSKIVIDPFADMFKGNVLEELLSNPETMVKFVHYALRSDNKALSKDVLAIKDMQSDTITEGLDGLDLEADDIGLYIIEHYGDGKDSREVEGKVKAAMDILETIFFSRNDEEDWEELVEIEKNEDGEKEEKSLSHFIVPNKPMYRIFEIEDIEQLKGFSGDWFVQEKYDGMRIQLHKLDGKVTIYSYNEKNITDKCSAQVQELNKKEYGDCILDGELILFDGDEALHRADTIAHVFKGKYKDAKLRCHVFDIMRHESQTLTDEELSNRMTILFNNYSAKSGEAIAYPSKKDTRQADNLEDLEKYSKEMMEIPTAEGVVIKDATSTYYIGTKKNPKWIKWKNFVDLDVIVLDKNKTKSNLFSYSVGVGPVLQDAAGLVEIKGQNYMNVGKALNTKINVDVGDIIRVKVDEVKKKGESYSLFSAKVIEVPEVEYPDKPITLEILSQDTKKSLNYDVVALEKGIKVTDHIHGETTIIAKYDTSGFVLYGFEENNLMSKNALADLDMWKNQAEEVMKGKNNELALILYHYLRPKPRTIKETHEFLNRKYPALYEDTLQGKETNLADFVPQRDGLEKEGNKFLVDPSKVLQEDTIAKSAMSLILESANEGGVPMTGVPITIERQKETPMVSMSYASTDEDKCCNDLKQQVLQQTFDVIDKETAKGKTINSGFLSDMLNYLEKNGIVPDGIDELKAICEYVVYNQDCDDFVRRVRERENQKEFRRLIEEYDRCKMGFGSDFTDKYAMLKAYKTPKEYRTGKFKIYDREDGNVSFGILVGDESMFWTIQLDDEEELFDLFGAAGKYPAEVSKSLEQGKVIDSGNIELGVQRNGYHEYFLKGNKFETKLHIRYLPVQEKKMWLAWTGYKQEPADTEGDEGIWNIYEDKFAKTPLPE
jgi:hypothetical protein